MLQERSLVNVKGSSFECARAPHDGLPVHILMYGNETMVWRKIRVMQIDNVNVMLDIKRIGKVPNARMRSEEGSR